MLPSIPNERISLYRPYYGIKYWSSRDLALVKFPVADGIRLPKTAVRKSCGKDCQSASPSPGGSSRVPIPIQWSSPVRDSAPQERYTGFFVCNVGYSLSYASRISTDKPSNQPVCSSLPARQSRYGRNMVNNPTFLAKSPSLYNAVTPDS